MRVLIVDDHPLFRDGLRSLLEVRGIDVVAFAVRQGLIEPPPPTTSR
jgi:DNA-binding NarL/FixJ family response regulator